MLKPLIICATVAMLLVSMLLPVQAAAPSACASEVTALDVCPAPAPSAPSRVSLEKPCLTCVLPAAAALRAPAYAQLSLSPAIRFAAGSDRVVPPDHRPPRI
ncbi:hypothetical protein [Pseudooceanicola sp. MF1-13]|uniref:hypothetical protein n=1 Tax=Pseudooceanicola sp. MF1-13 TaxID=3379095 RepID=UPI0038925755